MTTKQDARKLDALGKEDLRRRVVRAVLHEGLSKAEAARVFGVSRTSCMRGSTCTTSMGWTD
jgi:transposase